MFLYELTEGHTSSIVLYSIKPELSKSHWHTCDDFKRGIREIFEKKEIPDSFWGDFQFLLKKRIFTIFTRLVSWSLPDDEESITCIHLSLDGGKIYFLPGYCSKLIITGPAKSDLHLHCMGDNP